MDFEVLGGVVLGLGQDESQHMDVNKMNCEGYTKIKGLISKSRLSWTKQFHHNQRESFITIKESSIDQ